MCSLFNAIFNGCYSFLSSSHRILSLSFISHCFLQSLFKLPFFVVVEKASICPSFKLWEYCTHVSVCICVNLTFLTIIVKAWELKKWLSLRCSATFYWVELLITDNPVAFHLLLSPHVSHPLTLIVVLLPFCLFTSYVSLPSILFHWYFVCSTSFCHFLFSLSQFSPES